MDLPRTLAWALVLGCSVVETTGPATAVDADNDSSDARARREVLVGLLAHSVPVSDERVLDALRRVPRHLFMPGAGLDTAYDDHAHPIGNGQTISQPTVVAIMTEALKVGADHRVLEIGTGSGYQAAILSLLAREVYSIEIIPALGEAARDRLARLGYANASMKIGDGYLGWPEHAPFDRIILTAAPHAVPQALFDQLKDGGILVAPLGDDADQYLYRWTKSGERLERENLGAVRFVPMVQASPRGIESPGAAATR